MALHATLALLALPLALAQPPSPTTALFTVNVSHTHQVILGLGFEIQSDSIGSGNHGLPNATTSVPWDLVPSERSRLYSDMLAGFRLCRLALGLYFRGLTPDAAHIVERWPGQAAALADMSTRVGLEGFAVEYWSPAPFWKSNGAYIDGGLRGTDAAFMGAFAAAVAADARYLAASGLHPAWWGLQNEPYVGPSGCIYSCAGINASTYHLAFRAAAGAVRADFPDTLIHASSGTGQHWSPQLAADPEALALVDAWTFHRVGADSNDQIANRAYFLNGSAGRPVLNNEYEYLDSRTNPNRTLNTAQSIMNWFVFEDAPAWFWLHALKPLTTSEAAGYGLGYWNPVADPVPGALPPGHWEYNPDNFNAVAGFARYLPWDSVRVEVAEDEVRGDQRVLAYLFDPARARWAGGAGGAGAAGSSRATLRDPSRARAAATHLGVVLSNRWVAHSFSARVALAGAAGGAAPEFDGFAYGPNVTGAPLGRRAATRNATSGEWGLDLVLAPLTLQFWVQAVA